MTLLCPHCFDERTLKRRIVEERPTFPNHRCTYHPRYKGIPIEAVARIVGGVFRTNYSIGEHISVPRGDTDDVDHEQYGSSLIDQIYSLTQATSDEIATTLVRRLIDDDDYWPPDGGEPFFADDQYYVRHDGGDYGHSELWRRFCESIVYDQRFFNSQARDLIGEIFDGIHLQKDTSRLSPVYEITPGEPQASFYRARIGSDNENLRAIESDPEVELGPPPARLRRAGRMNAAGVAVFYGAYDMDTCVAELRPAVGNILIGAQFDLARPIHVLDTTRFIRPGKELSLFAKDHIRRLAQWKFMQTFMHEIAKPILPSDEHLDYIPTQAVAEYLAHHHEFHFKGHLTRIEGIIFRSAQYPNGKNIVLVGEAASVLQRATSPTKGQTKSRDDPSYTLDEMFPTSRLDSPNPSVAFRADSVEKRIIRTASYQSEKWSDADDLSF